jgi:tRNA dimethylallyltransferase
MIAVVGPTASGKTALAIKLARRFNGEIVSADSRQVYRGMDIGTAKPTKAEMRAVPHHLIDIKDPDEEYAVAEYKRDAVAAIHEILARKKVPILVGGTGLYVKTVLENLDIPHVPARPALRKKIEKEIEKKGLDEVFKKLIALDPEAAYVVDPKNPRRVVRALEVALATGRPFTAQRLKQEPLFETLVLGLDPPPAILRKKMDRRVDAMMKAGLIKEVKRLVKRYGEHEKAFDAIGYREIIGYLNGVMPLAEAAAAMRLNTRRYAKRQMTWFGKDESVHWVKDGKEAEKLVHNFLMK